jgi:hypothetical protein
VPRAYSPRTFLSAFDGVVVERGGAEYVAPSSRPGELRGERAAGRSRRSPWPAWASTTQTFGGIEHGERNVAYTNLRRLPAALEVKTSEPIALAEAIEGVD